MCLMSKNLSQSRTTTRERHKTIQYRYTFPQLPVGTGGSCVISVSIPYEEQSSVWPCAVPSFTCFRMVCVPTGARGAMEACAVLVICIAACLVGGSNPVGAAGFPFLVRRRDVSAPSAVLAFVAPIPPIGVLSSAAFSSLLCVPPDRYI